MPDLYYKRNLPHYQPLNAVYFITFRLAYSLPKAIIEQLKMENELMEKSILRDKDKSERDDAIYK